ncbi:BREX-2 system adenine-specific DNA-methyltransferase PglX [Embleya sp. NPDC050493]|uniref:BREX-2 system adenine-specific DNA-methyltransferase PglX n=1 Tax=Embleya sp. NPDC050493 TaxID=3363989 RepID=UPI00378FDAB0
MIDRKALLDDLKQQVKAVETDLGKQVKALPEVKERLDKEYRRAREVGRTGATWNSWLDERITQVAAAWVLGTVFVRFCEDNLLIPEPYLTGPSDERRDLAVERYLAYSSSDPDPTYRGWMERAFAEIGEGQAGRLLFNPERNPLYQVPLSHEGARDLIDFWQKRDAEGVLVHDFTDPLNEDGTDGWDTRFLGDLYQDLSEAARKTYALLQTPEFVEEFILDRTMSPVVRELASAFGELKMIDPTCGSGHFVLGAFRRMTQLWAERQPHVDRHERVRAALNAVHGVDINPFAVAIARFRLLVAALATAGMRTLEDAKRYEWPIHLAVGDSLIGPRQLELALVGEDSGDSLADFAYATEDIHEPEHKGILEQGRYHVVVGNPPYITVKDSKLKKLYRDLYPSCAGSYALSVPFAERFFQLAKIGEMDGRNFGLVGQITSNSFMKREFGAKLIEEYFAHKVELTEVIDTSGAYIPGHGTPTVILIGRRRGGKGRALTVRTVRSVQSEPSMPETGANGLVWKAIIDQIDEPGAMNQWVSVDDLERTRYFEKQPWILSAGGLEMVEQIEKGSTSKLASLTERVGFCAVTREDDAYMIGARAALRLGIPETHVKTFFNGSSIRNWSMSNGTGTIFPYSDESRSVSDSPEVTKILWPNRTLLRLRKALSGTQEEQGLTWFEFSSFSPKLYWSDHLISFAFVSTHNEFALRGDSGGFIRTAPVIKMSGKANKGDYLRLLGLLNSSTACFWLKMNSHDKGGSGLGRGFQDEAWENRFEFSGTTVQDFPLPGIFSARHASSLNHLAQELAATSPAAITTPETPTPTADILRRARVRWESTRARMIAQQEELDWQVYAFYGLHVEDLTAPEEDVPELALAERAFEIALARRVEANEASDEWFERHSSNPITSFPGHWSNTYKTVVQKRIEAMETSRAIGMVERPAYKRRWVTDGWDILQERALRGWLLDRMENHDLWYEEGNVPTLVTLSRLIDSLSHDDDFVSVAGLYTVHRDLPGIVANLLTDEHVPFLAALRYKAPSGLKKRSDWERVWDLQRQEDAASDEVAKRKIRDAIPVPPKYVSADFLKPSYWRARGKLDVPRERFISYPLTITGTPEVYGWAGWDHKEQAQALTTYFTNHVTTTEEMTPLLAGLLELQPWLNQWHDGFDPAYGMSPAAFFAAYRSQIQGENGLTDDDLRAWRPPAGRKPRAAKTKR